MIPLVLWKNNASGGYFLNVIKTFQRSRGWPRLVPLIAEIFRPRRRRVPLQPSKTVCVISSIAKEEMRMKKTLAILATVATVAATTVAAPAQARGLGPGLAFGLAAGAIAAGAAGAYGYYGPGYGYYGYGPAYYGPGPYAYYGGPYYRHRHWRHYY
jgi:hypothetical protein